MCGIYGQVGAPGSTALRDLFEASLSHRGPDGRGHFSGSNALIGNLRLAILDPEHGVQPFTSADSKISIVQNGEIYNFVELADELRASGIPLRTRCDTEVLLRLFERDGPAFVKALNGMFAIAVYDENRRAVWLYRDRLGEKPLYYARCGASLWFGSEIKALLAGGLTPCVDPLAIDQYLTLNYVPGPGTIFQGVYQLPPGYRARIDIDTLSLTLEPYWDLSLQRPREGPREEWLGELSELFEDSIRLRLRSDVPYGAFLSGGVDSGSVVAFMSRLESRPVSTFSIGFCEEGYDETASAREVAGLFGTCHHELRCGPEIFDDWPRALYYCDQPHGDTSFLPTLRVAALAVPHVKVCLSGDGGDELFAGYERYLSMPGSGCQGLSLREFGRSYFDTLRVFSPQELQRLYRPEFTRQLDPDWSSRLLQEVLGRVEHWDRLNQALFFDTVTLLPGNNLVKPDRMGMAVSLEARTPFMDHRLVERAFQIPGALKIAGGESKSLFKGLAARHLPHSLVYRPKQMFVVPFQRWLEGPLRARLTELLCDGSLSERGWFESSALHSLVAEHFGGKNHYRKLRALAALELWARAFLDPGEPGKRTAVASEVSR